MRKFWCIVSSLLTVTLIISVSFSSQRTHKDWRNLFVSPVKMTKKDFNNKPNLKSDDPDLLSYIRRKYLDFPSDKPKPYSIPVYLGYPDGQHIIVDKILRQKTNGVFVEAGAYDGVSLSNTLYLEAYRNWTGLLVEPDIINYENLKKVNRKSISSNSCLSSFGYPEEVTLLSSPYPFQTKIATKEDFDYRMESLRNKFKSAQCFPLESLLWAANITTIDYFSLDVEGHELEVLKKFPFENFTIKVISVEFIHIPEGEFALTDFMKTKNFTAVRRVKDLLLNRFVDIIYVHHSVLNDLNLEEIANVKLIKKELNPIYLKKSMVVNFR